ncbi:MAG: gamma-glutamyl-gamma-aminobutyrate hydrolase family protein [Pseudomonadota bacterium]
MSRKSIILIPACTKDIDAQIFYAVIKRYIDAVVVGAECHPLILPLLDSEEDLSEILSRVDGVMLTGSPSNVHPSNYGQPIQKPDLPLDLARDAITLRLAREAIEIGMPLFSICRGFQEVNVALGGSLLQAVHEVPGKFDHREDDALPIESQYAPAHRITVVPGGRLHQILGSVSDIQVNSLHGQGIDQLAPGLTVDAVADDGLVEAYHVATGHGFTLALQWHPEWKVTENSVSMKLFGAFGDACRAYSATRQSNPKPIIHDGHALCKGGVQGVP